MAVTAAGWLLFVGTVAAVGFALLGPHRFMRGRERLGTGFVIGSSALPLVLFTGNAALHLGVLSAGFTVFLVLALTLLLLSLRARPRLSGARRGEAGAGDERRTSNAARPRRARYRPFDAAVCLTLLAALLLFFLQVVHGVSLPIFGWDEYSFWLYAAKVLYLNHGAATAMLKDAYASYPLGFPYLIAWCYHLTGGISITHAKVVTPLITAGALLGAYSALRRAGARPPVALFGLAAFAWGSRMVLWYNFVAFGEMIYVDTYTLGALYCAVWMRTRRAADLYVGGALLGLAAFLRVDGIYIDIFTAVLLLLFAEPRLARSLRRPERVRLAAFSLPPAILWTGYELHHHISGGWLSRLSWHDVSQRLDPAFLGGIVSAMWQTIADPGIYPIIPAAAVAVGLAIWQRNRPALFLLATAAAQIVYLFVSYLTVFSRFEALHASAMDRYLLRIDPLIAFALACVIAVWYQEPEDQPANPAPLDRT